MKDKKPLKYTEKYLENRSFFNNSSNYILYLKDYFTLISCLITTGNIYFHSYICGKEREKERKTAEKFNNFKNVEISY